IYRLLSWDDGKFSFSQGPACVDQPLHLTRRQLILEALNLYDEEQKIIMQFPPSTSRLKLELPEMIVAEDRAQEVAMLFDGSLRIGELFEQLRGDFEALKIALALYRTSKERQLTLIRPQMGDTSEHPDSDAKTRLLDSMCQAESGDENRKTARISDKRTL